MATEDARTRLLHAAGEVFAELGYRGATVREISARAGVNAASVNYYFRDKESLYFEAVDLARQLRAEQFPLPDRPADTPPEVRLRDFVTTMVHRMLEEERAAWNTQLMIREILQPTEACRRLVKDYFEPQFQILMGIIRELLPTDAPSHVCRKIGFSIVGQCVYYRVGRQAVQLMTPPDEWQAFFQVDQIADHIVRVALAALCAVPAYSEEDLSAASDRPEAGPVIESARVSAHEK